MRSLRCKLIISIAALLLLSTGTLSVVFNYSIEGIFEKYAYYCRLSSKFDPFCPKFTFSFDPSN